MNSQAPSRRGDRIAKRLLIAAAIGLLLSLYCGSYVLFSLQGRYEPGSIGLGGVKNYRWAPKGFVNSFVWNESLVLAYYPLHILDIRLWHSDDEAYGGKYPINEVAPEDIGKVYDAWDEF